MTEQISPTAGVVIHLDPEALMRAMVPEFGGYDRDGEPWEDANPVSARIVSLVAAKIADEARATIIESARQAITEQVSQIVANTLAEGVRRTNTWGEPTGEPTTVAGLVRDEVSTFLNKETGDFRNRDTALKKMVRELVDNAIKTDMRAALDEARKAIRDRVTSQAAEVITETVRRATL